MPDFNINTIQDDDRIVVTDLDPEVDGSSDALSLVLLTFARKIPFLKNTHTKNTSLALLICVFMLLFLVQPDLSSVQALRTGVPSQYSAQLAQSSILSGPGTSPTQVIWIKIANGVEIVRQAPPGIKVWRHCNLQTRHFPRTYQSPRIYMCK